MAGFDRQAAEALLADAFAPWIQDLGLSVERIEADGTVLRMRFSDRLCRDNGVVCGQALMSLADTAFVFAVSAACGAYRAMTTVDQTMHFLRPVRTDALAEARVLRLGRSMAFGHVTISTEDDPSPAATAQTAYALLDRPGAHPERAS